MSIILENGHPKAITYLGAGSLIWEQREQWWTSEQREQRCNVVLKCFKNYPEIPEYAEPYWTGLNGVPRWTDAEEAN